ncbi:MAG: response regulator transcription factor [Planctomycetota bacterium]
MTKLRILVVDDHELFRLGIIALINLQDDMEAVGEAGSGREALEIIPDSDPDVVVTDLQMPSGDGLWLCHAVQRAKFEPNILVLTTFDGDFDVLNCLQAGASGFLRKDAQRDELLGAIREIGNGRQYLSPEIASKLASVIRTEHLTMREREILSFVAEGSANKEIALRLGISEGTVKSHMNNMMGKLDVAGRTEAVVTAIRRGIIRL